MTGNNASHVVSLESKYAVPVCLLMMWFLLLAGLGFYGLLVRHFINPVFN
jgi:hypothetical protein